MAFSLVMVLGLYWLIWTTGGGVVVAGGRGVLRRDHRAWASSGPVLILPLFYRIEKLDVPEFTDRLARLAQGTGLSIEGVYRLDLSDETVKANAMLAGLGRTRRVLLGDTLLAGFSARRNRSHLRPRDWPPRVPSHPQHDLGGTGLQRGGLLAVRPAADVVGRPRRRPADYAQLPVDTLPLLLLILTVFRLLLQPLQNAVSRRFERQCDRYALERTGRKDAYLSAFRKLARLNKDDPNPHWLDVFLFHSHPPVAERLAMAEEVGKSGKSG